MMTSLTVRSPPAGVEKPRRHTSFSAISTYQTCPLKYAFKYLQQIPEDVVSASLVLGSSIHGSLQHHFECLLIGQPAPSLDKLLEVFWDEWRSREDQRVVFNKGEGIADIARLAERMLRAFQGSELARPEGRILAIEEQLHGVVVQGVPELLARVDLVTETEDHLKIVDFKTARSQWSTHHVADAASQLMLYGELVKDFAPGKPLKLAFGVITKAKFPDVTIHPAEATAHQVERTKAIIQRVWRSIEGGNFYPTPSGMGCATCPYWKPCKAWKG